MDELDGIIQRMIDAGETEENIKLVIEDYEAQNASVPEPAKTEAVATETAPVTAVNEAVDTELASEDGSLESENTKERDSLVFNIAETEKQINNYIAKGGEVNKSDAAVLQGYKNELSALDKLESDNKFVEGVLTEPSDPEKDDNLKDEAIGANIYQDNRFNSGEQAINASLNALGVPVQDSKLDTQYNSSRGLADDGGNNWTNSNPIWQGVKERVFRADEKVNINTSEATVFMDYEERPEGGTYEELIRKVKKLEKAISITENKDELSAMEKALGETKELIENDFTSRDGVKIINVPNQIKRRLSSQGTKIRNQYNKESSEYNVNKRIVDRGVDHLSEDDQEFYKLNNEFEIATGDKKIALGKKLEKIAEDRELGDKLYDRSTGKLIDITPAEIKKNEEAESLAAKTGSESLKNTLVDYNFQIAGLAEDWKAINNYDEKPQLSALASSGPLSKEDTSMLNDIAKTGMLPRNLHKIDSDSPIAKTFNSLVDKYEVTNKAIQINRNPLTDKEKEFFTEFVDGAMNVFGADMTTKREANDFFLESLTDTGAVSKDYIGDMKAENEPTITQEVFRGVPHLAAFVVEVGATRKLSGNLINKGLRAVEKGSQFLLKGNKYAQAGVNAVFNGLIEAGEFGLTAAVTNTVFNRDESVAESIKSGAAFGFGGTMGRNFFGALGKYLNKSPLRYTAAEAKIYRGLSSSKTLGAMNRSFQSASGGATSYIAGSVLMDPIDYKYEEMGRTYVTEFWKMFALGKMTKAIQTKGQSVTKSFENVQSDILSYSDLNTQAFKGAKILGVDTSEIKKPNKGTRGKIRAAHKAKHAAVTKEKLEGLIDSKEAAVKYKSNNQAKLAVENNVAINQAKAVIEKSRKLGDSPTPGEQFVATQKLSKGEDINAKDSKIISNLSPELILDARGLDINKGNLTIAKEFINRESSIQAILDGGTGYFITEAGFKATEQVFEGQYRALDGKLRDATYEFLNTRLQLDNNLHRLNQTKTSDLTPIEKANLEKAKEGVEAQLMEYMVEGVKYEELQAKISEDTIKRYEKNKAIGEGRAEKGISKGKVEEALSKDKFQEAYDKIPGLKKIDVKEHIAFTDPKTGDRVVNKVRALEVRNTEAFTHEGDHAILLDVFKGPDGKISSQGIKTIDKILSSLSPKRRAILDKEVAGRYDTKEDKKEWYEENLTVLGELINKKVIVFDKTLGEKLKGMVPFLKEKYFKNLEIDSTTGTGMFELLKGLGENSPGVEQATKRFTTEAAKNSTESKATKAPQSSAITDLTQKLERLDKADFDYDTASFNAAKSNLEFKIRAAKKKEASKPKKITKFDTSESSVIGQINNLVPKEITTNAEYKENTDVQRAIDEAFAPNGIIHNIIAGRAGKGEWGMKILENVKLNAIKYDPSKERKKAGNDKPVTFAEAIFSNINFGTRQEAFKGKQEADRKNKETGLDTKEAQSIANKESSGPTADSRKTYVSLTNTSKMIPNFLVTSVKTKLVGVISKLTSKLSDKKGKNAQTTPLIAEIKTAISKVVGDPEAIPKQVIKRMGNPKDGSYQTYLVANKKTILENMTTTYLQTAIPAAVEKSVGGKFRKDKNGEEVKDSNDNNIFDPKFVPYPEWVGKKIDRAKVSTDKIGSTSGNDIVKRVDVPDEIFVANFVGSDGKVVRGKREGLGKAIAEEIAFEVLTKEIAKESSDIRKAFDKNQTALQEVLVDNLVEIISKDAERGTVKFSAVFTNKSPETKENYLNGIRGERFRNMFLATARNSKNPLRESLVEHFTKFPVEGLTPKEIKQIAIDFSKDYVFDKQEIGVTRVIIQEGQKAALDHVVRTISGRVDRGTSWGDVQRMLEGKVSKLDLKNLTDINEGRLSVRDLSYKLIEEGFSGNQVFSMLSYTYGPSGIGGFKGVPVKGKKDGRVTPEGLALIERELGPINFKTDKETGKLTTSIDNRGALVLSKADFIQNFLPDSAKKDGKPTGEKIAISNKVAKKDFYTIAESVWNRLTDLGKKKEAKELWELGKSYGENLVDVIKAIQKLDVTPAARRELVTGLFASMSAAGKIPSTVRFYPSTKDGTLLTFSELVKLFGREDGKVDKGVFEHTKPANRIAIASYIYSITGKKTDLDILEKELLDYDTAMITEGMDIGLRKLKLQSRMGLNYKAGDKVMGTRYAELITRMEAEGVTFWDAKTGKVISPAGALGPRLNQEMKASVKPVETSQKAINNARSLNWSKSRKKIRVFDFDDTLARTKSNVLYTMPDGTKGKINAATFAKEAGRMEAEGAQWDFSEFSKVMEGKKGPLLDVAKIIADKRGTKDVFVLTARPADAAGPIQEFLASMGLKIPIENITGLGNGTPKAKADWVVDKVADGYNDFYFADDHLGNVKAVKNALDTFDVKGKVQLAKVKFSATLDTKFNDMIQRHKGVESFKEFSKATGQRRGKKTGKWKFFISPSAEDFRGLTQYKFAGKGKQGEADQKFFEESLMDPYFQGVAAVESARQVIKEDTKALLKMFKPVKKKLNKLIKGEEYTYDAAARVYLWNKAGKEIPGLSKRDNKKLNDIVANDLELSSFAEGLLTVSKKDSWPDPKEHWMAETTLSDLNNLTEKANRKEYLTEFIENVDTIFSEKNLNKVEALYGEASRKAIENSIYAMKTGSNSSNQSSDAITSKWTNWVNNSIGTIMFFNRRSAVLQTLSSANFINWSDNNPAKAALAFANQPQYWKDFAMIFNSNKLKQRRGGLKSDVQEAEIANAAKNSQDKAQAIIAYILKIGFTPTQIADSFAISMGGASMYRNRVKTYTKEGMDLKDAETKAFQDFSKLSDESQQSGDPALVSQQQRSIAGRLILSFQNTTMQYTRLMKKHGQDLINNRGDKKTHVSAILYFGAVQNFLFNALSKTAFALIPGFDDDEEEDENKKDQAIEKKAADVLNGMSDSVVRGTGIYGAIFTTLKNSYATWERENEKGFTGDQTKTIIELANLSPAIGSKLRKVYSGIQANQFDKDIIEKHPWSVTIDGRFNPSATYSIIANLGSAAVNLPLDRALAEARSVAEMLDDRNSKLQRIALGLGWRTWNVGAKNEEFDLIKAAGKAKRKEEGKEKAKKTRAKNKAKKEKAEKESLEAYKAAYMKAKQK